MEYRSARVRCSELPDRGLKMAGLTDERDLGLCNSANGALVPLDRLLVGYSVQAVDCL